MKVPGNLPAVAALGARMRGLYQRTAVAKRASIGASFAACLSLVLATPSLADQSPTNPGGPPEGVFGVNEKCVPVPWNDFELTSGNVLLVLDASRASMAAAPQLAEDVFDSQVAFGRQSEKVAAYWRTHGSN